MVKRILTLIAALGLLAVAGCAAGKDGAEAQELLQKATEAQEQIESMTFSMNVVGEAAGQAFTMKMSGGGYLKGDQQGDMVVRATMTIPTMPATSFEMISREGSVYMNLDGTWQQIPGGTAQADQQLEQALAGFDFAKYVTDVSVEKGTTFLGEPVTKIVGTIDTQGLLGGLLDQLGAAAGGLTGGFAPPQEALDALGNIRAVLYVNDATNLVQAARMDFSVEAEGETAQFDVSYALRSVNEPVEIPEPAVTA
jgi:outer membrane lipoprotein-sorting protein